MRLLPKSIHRCRRYPTKFNSGRDIPGVEPAEDLRFGMSVFLMIETPPHGVKPFRLEPGVL